MSIKCKTMLKPKFLIVFVFSIIKYLAFFIILSLIGDRFSSLVIKNSDTTKELLMNTGSYLLYILFFSIIFGAIFSIPLYFIFKIKNPIYLSSLILFLLIVEYFIYTTQASPSEWSNGLYNALVSALFIWMFFFRHFRSLFKGRSHGRSTNE